MFNLLILLFAFINALYSREYSKIPDLDDYVVPDKPIEYSFDNNEYNDLFQKEYRNYDDTRSFNKQGKKLSKADLMPEQCRGSFHNTFAKSSNYSMKIHHDSMIALRVCKNLLKKENVNYEQLGDYLNKINVPKDFCPYAQKIECKKYNKYRTYDGSCNNMIQPFIGKSETPLKRLHPPRYHDMMSEPVKKSVTGKALTNPRMIGYTLNYPMDIEIKINTLFVFWGQFVDHDLSLTGLITGEDKKPKACTCDSKDPDCLNIPIPKADPIIKDQKCMVTPRSSASFPKFNCKLGIREQVNLLSHYCDLSQVYGVTEEDNGKIRLGKDGLLRASAIPGIRYEHLPIAEPNSTLCASEKKGARCFKGVETRVNQNLVLLSLHTLWLREHNRVARTLKYLNPYWNDEKIFQDARRICIAQYQHIIYKGWIPLVIGKEMSDFYDASVSSDNDYFYGYNPKVNPHISNEFTTAAFRFGHTLLTSFVVKADTSLNLISNMSLTDHLLNTQEAYKNLGLDGVLRGSLRQKSTANDGHITNTLNNELFKNPDKNAETHQFSLSGLNVNRGRDHGLAPYTSYRRLCGLHVPTSFDEMSYMHSDSLDDMKKVYDHVDDIDLFSGGITEKPVEGGLVGPVFASIIAKQWSDLKYGDRHYYENGHDKKIRYSLAELNEIRKASMGRLLCDNIDIDFVPKNPWLVDSYENPLVNCDSLPRVNLRVFKYK